MFVDLILLMEDFSLHWGGIKSCKNHGINYGPHLVRAGFFRRKNCINRYKGMVEF